MKITAKELLLKKQNQIKKITDLEKSDKISNILKEQIINSNLFFYKIDDYYLDTRRVSNHDKYENRYKPLNAKNTKCKVYLKDSNFLISIIDCFDFFQKLKYFTESDLYNNPKKINTIESISKNSKEVLKEKEILYPILNKIMDSQGNVFYSKDLKNKIIEKEIKFYKIINDINEYYFVDTRRFDFIYSDFVYMPTNADKILKINNNTNQIILEENNFNFFHRLKFIKLDHLVNSNLSDLDVFRFNLDNLHYLHNSKNNLSDIVDSILSVKYDYSNQIYLKESSLYIYAVQNEIISGVVDLIDTNGKFVGSSPNTYNKLPKILGYK